MKTVTFTLWANTNRSAYADVNVLLPDDADIDEIDNALILSAADKAEWNDGDKSTAYFRDVTDIEVGDYTEPEPCDADDFGHLTLVRDAEGKLVKGETK